MLIAARRMRRARSKTQSIYSRGGVPQVCSYSEAKTATYAQEGGNGATSESRAKDVSNHEEGVAAETSCFNINLNRASYGR